eukprot:531437-Amphidinium_carterae.1
MDVKESLFSLDGLSYESLLSHFKQCLIDNEHRSCLRIIKYLQESHTEDNSLDAYDVCQDLLMTSPDLTNLRAYTEWTDSYQIEAESQQVIHSGQRPEEDIYHATGLPFHRICTVPPRDKQPADLDERQEFLAGL